MLKKSVKPISVVCFLTPSSRGGFFNAIKSQKMNFDFMDFEAMEDRRWLKEVQPDIILVDYHKDLSGTILRFLEATKREIPIIFLTDLAHEQDVLDLVNTGLADYLFNDRLKKLPLLIRKMVEKYPSERTEQEGDLISSESAELKVRENETKYLSIFENSIDGILLTVPDGKILAANPSACSMFQMTEEELCRVGVPGIIDVEEESQRALHEEHDKEGKVKAEVVMKRKDGSKFPAEITSSLFRNAHGEQRTSMIVRDISEYKKAQEQLQLSKDRYKQLFEYNPLPNVIYDEETLEIIDVNASAVNFYKISPEEFKKRTVLDFLPEDEIPRLKAIIKEGKKELGDMFQHRMIHLKKDSSRIAVETYGYPLRYKQRNCRLVICLDISERERYLEEIRQKSLKLQAAQKIAKLGYWELDLTSNELFWSEEVYGIWNKNSKSFKPTLEFLMNSIHGEDRRKFQQERQQALAGSKILEIEYRIVLEDGRVKWVSEKGELSTGDGKLFSGSVQDITERKVTDQRLSRSEARHRGILKSQTNYLIRTDLEGKYTYYNEKFSNDFSWIFSDGELLGKQAKNTIEEYHHQRVEEVFHRCIKNPNHVVQVEIDKLQPDGSSKSTLWDFICLTDPLGKPIELQCVGIDITDRVKTEKSLRESNLRNELVIKASSDAIYDWDIKSNNLNWADTFYTMFGSTKEGLPSTIEAWAEKVHPEDRDPLTKSLDDTLQGYENYWVAEYRLRKGDGKYAYVVEKGFIVRDENNEALRMVGAVQDVTEKKKLEELLNEASRLARIGSFEVDLEMETLYWSPVTREIHEVDAEHTPTIEQALQFYKEGESRDTMSAAFSKAIEENVPFDLELQVVTVKGNERWVRTIGTPTFVDGRCVKINGSFQDITNIKNSEIEALKASEEKEVILESIGDAFFAVDENWIVTYWNSKSEELLNCSKEESLGKNLWDVFPDAVDTDFYRYYHKALHENTIEEFEEFLERTSSWYSVTAYPSKNGLSVYFRDVTERRRADLKLRELNKNLQDYTHELVTANKGLEQFSYIVSHNLRAPVANIIGLGDLIKEDFPYEVKENFLKEILSNVERLDSIIKDLSDILQVKVAISENKEPVVFEDLVASIRLGIDHLIKKEEVKIFTNFSAVPSFSAVRTYLHSIFYNLIFNSIKYRHPDRKPVIEINSEVKNDKLILVFKDNGIGIDLVKKGDELFSLYKRFHHHVEGKGMGLFMVKTQVELMGGKIEASSVENEGTIFNVEFPISEDRKDIKSENDRTVHYN